MHEGKELSVGAAWGCHPLMPGHKAEEAMAQADAAMYARKQAQKAEARRKQA